MARSGARMQSGVATDVWKTTLGDYLHAAKDLLSSMQRIGFDKACSIPLDVNGEILNGSHRIGCAKALRIGEIPVLVTTSKVWAPAWDRDWFLKHGMPENRVADLEMDM